MVNNFMQSIADDGGLKGNGKHYTNHNVRRLIIPKLRKAEVSSREMQSQATKLRRVLGTMIILIKPIIEDSAKF